ncbi:418_t:CDS:10 [Funneliformis geosporum]|uniref:418_t:CDS:1 n=1 Tax=Funneliformis geosporum TaxID=1117311 RepID=A0A9W4SKI7_9GLOM|nr:418_t:CDS:10 [Funneliformis geosporum]
MTEQIEKEIELLEKVELRIALAETDQKLEKILDTFLSPILLKLESPHEVMRTKVMSILAHINKRIRPKTNIKLPLIPLLDLVCTIKVTKSIFVKNFGIMYLEMAYSRLTDEEQIANLPSLVKGIDSKPLSQKQTLMHIILLALKNYKPKHADSPAELDPFDFKTHPGDANFLLESFLDVILYRQINDKPIMEQQDPQLVQLSSVPPGLSINAVKFVTNDGKAQWVLKNSELILIKTGVLKFINSSVILPDSLHEIIHFKKFLVLLSASCDSAHEVVRGGEDGLKRNKKPDLENKIVVDGLYSLYQGSQTGTVNNLDQQIRRQPASPSLKYKIMSYLCKSKLATNIFPALIQVSFDCLYGPSTNAKLQNQGMGFIQWVARMADTSILKPVAPVLLSGLLKLINEPGGSEGGNLRAGKEDLRGFAYVAVSLLARRGIKIYEMLTRSNSQDTNKFLIITVPEIFRKDLSIIANFFMAITVETKNVKISVQEALSNMTEAYQNAETWANEDEIRTIENILEENIDKSEHQARYCAVKYATSLFPFSHILSRYICLLASADEKLEVKEMASRGLAFPNSKPHNLDQSNIEIKIPPFLEFVNFINNKSSQRTKKLINILQSSQSTGKKYVLGYRTEVYINILRFLRHLMIVNADPKALIDEFANEFDDEPTLFDSDTRTRVKSWLKEQWIADHETSDQMELEEYKHSGTLNVYLGLIENGLSNEGQIDPLLQSTASSCLLELISLGPSSLSRSYESRVSWLKDFLKVIKLEVRNAMAHILGIVSTSEMDSPERCAAIHDLIKELFTIARDQSRQISVEYHHGSILSLGYIIGRLTYRYPKAYKSMIPSNLLSEAIELISKDLDSSTNLYIIGASKALGEAGRYTSLQDSINVNNKGKRKMDDASPSPDIVEKLINVVKTTKDVKVKETSIITLGHIALGEPNYAEKILSLFYDLATIINKQVEVHFTIGESITCIAAGWESNSMGQYLDIADASPSLNTIDNSIMEGILVKLFNELLPSNKTSVKKAVCVWMLCIVKFCSKHEVVKAALPRIHGAFSLLLADRDEFTQEVASKGIGLVYELGDQKIREQLVDSLVGMFSEGKRPKETIDQDTQLFDSNTLGQTPDGSAISTYQSILSLASDMNQPELVYKFMQLASHNAMWQSRKGAAFGFSSIIAQAEKELEPYLKDLIPRLYRFQYDPNPRVNEAMTSIWKSLVKDPKNVIDEYFDIIVKDLLKGLGDRLWRTRESSANALTDLLQGRQIQQLEPYLQDLWNMSFRALDDESVRIAAFKTCRSLTKVTVKYCDPSNVSIEDGQKAMNIIMPFLLSKGLVSDAEDVRKFSLTTVLKICKTGKELLKPHIAEIVDRLLEGLSSMEPQVMNYLSFHVDKYDVTQEQLENSRLSAAKNSPMMEGIESCIDYIDEKVIIDLTPKLISLIRKGAGCARFVVSMCLKKAEIVKPHANTYLKALSGAILDVSPAVRKSYAVAVGYVAHLASDNTLIKFIGHLKKVYCENSEDEIRSITGITMHEISKHASDEMKRIYVEVLPLTYYGKHDSDSSIKNVWNEIWEDNASGSTGTIKLYLNEIIVLLSTLLESPSWPTKRQAALTMADVAKSIEQSLIPHMEQVLPLLLDGLSGRTWAGKEALVEALAAASVSCREYFESDENRAQLDTLSKVLIRESKKSNKQYQRNCIENLGKFADAYSDTLELYPDVKNFLFELATAEPDPDEMEVDDANDRPLFLLVKASAVKCLGLVWSKKKEIQKQHFKELGALLASSLKSGKNVWNVRLCVLESLEKFIYKLDFSEPQVQVLDDETLISIFEGLKEGLLDTKYVAIRTASLSSLKKVVDKVKDTSLLSSSVKTKLLEIIDVAEKDPLASISEPAKELRKSILLIK